jgi:hypothetical protein
MLALLAQVFVFFLIFPTRYVSAADEDDEDDAYDLSFLTKGAAIGDSCVLQLSLCFMYAGLTRAIIHSYAAGIGAGEQTSYYCSRYDGSYSILVASQLGVDPKKLDFTYKACSGAVVDQVIGQAKALSEDQQFIIVSAVRKLLSVPLTSADAVFQGGNDAKLINILNSCVYGFLPIIAHTNCEKVLETSRSRIASNDFQVKLDNLIDATKSKLTQDGDMYVPATSSRLPDLAVC